MMKRGVEHRDLGNVFTEKITSCQNTLDVIWVVKWRQVDAVFFVLDHSIVDQRRLPEQLTANPPRGSDDVHVDRTLDFGHA
jgi:hypothetical protein